MRRFFLCTAALLAALSLSAQVDSTGRAVLAGKLEEYCAAMLTLPISSQCEEVDFIIGSCGDPAIRRETAEFLFDHFHDSKVMGLDAVAVHIYDKWFGKGGMKMSTELKGLTAGIFADFNRQSLIGEKAPSITLQDRSGRPVTLFGGESSKAAVLYFYAPDCAKCKIEGIMMRNVIENRDCPIDVYAICTTDKLDEWDAITSGSLAFSVRNTVVHHLWDPAGNKDWQLRYGVLQTPRMFLTDADGTIVGRGLDSRSLDRLLDAMFTPVSMVYGEEESRDFYDGLFDSYRQEQGALSTGNLMAVAEHIAARTLKEARDTMLYKQMEGDLLYYINFSGDGALRNGASAFAQEYILSREDIWNTPDDSLKVVGLAGMMKELADRSPVGAALPGLHVWGRRSTRHREYRTREWRLDRLAPRVDYIMFYNPGCQDCREQMELLKARHANGERLRVLKVDMQDMENSHPDDAREILDAFDLTFFPYMTRIDQKGVVTEKYSSFR